MFAAIGVTVLGLLLIVLGFWGGQTWRTPYGAIVAWCAPLGLLVLLMGMVLLFIPTFFA